MNSTSKISQQDMRSFLRASGLFDDDFYLRKYEDVARRDMDPLTHYLNHGSREARDPHPLFSGSYYVCQCPGLSDLGMSALAHYLLEGWRQFDPHVMFDTKFYLGKYPEVATSGMTPLSHYLNIGAGRGYDPCRDFDTSFYLAQDPVLAASGLNPLAHYILLGRKEGRYTRNNFVDGLPDSFPADYESLRKLEPLLPAAETLADLPLGRPLNSSRAGAVYFRLADRLLRPFSQLFIMPDLRSAGPQSRKALSDAIAEHGSPAVLLLLTDAAAVDQLALVDSDVSVASLTDLAEDLAPAEKTKVVVRLIIQARPQTVYNCGFEANPMTLASFRTQLGHFTRLIDIN